MEVRKYKKPEGQALIYESYDRLLNAWGVRVEEQDIPTSFGVTHVILAGEAEYPPLLLFHGVGDDSALMWVYNAAELAKRFRLVAVDTLGGPGKSLPGPLYYSRMDHGRWIGELMDALAIDHCDAAGVSMGAGLAIAAALAHPQRVRNIVCMAGGILSDFSWIKAFLPEALFPTQRNTVKLLKKLAYNADAFLKQEELLRHWSLLLKYFNNQSMMYHPLKKLTPADHDALRDRALFLIGDHDIIAYSDQKIQALKDARMRFLVIPEAGHGINHEQPDRIHRELFAFLLGDSASI